MNPEMSTSTPFTTIQDIRAMERGWRIVKMAAFQDDLDSASKIFARLNGYRKLNGFKQVQWDQVLCEVALSRSHHLVLCRDGVNQIGGSKYNLGVSYSDLASYIPIEEKDGRKVPFHRTIREIWDKFPGFSDALLDPLAGYAAVSVYASPEMICAVIFISMRSPTMFTPTILSNSHDQGEKFGKTKRMKSRKHDSETDGTDTDDDSDGTVTDKDSLNLSDNDADAKKTVEFLPVVVDNSESSLWCQDPQKEERVDMVIEDWHKDVAECLREPSNDLSNCVTQ